MAETAAQSGDKAQKLLQETREKLLAEAQQLQIGYQAFVDAGQGNTPDARATLRQLTSKLREANAAAGVAPAPKTGGKGAGKDDKDAEKAAKKQAEFERRVREDSMEHFRRMLAEEDERLAAQAKTKRELNVALLRAQGQDTQASLLELRQQYDEYLTSLGDSAEGLDLANKWFNAGEASIALADIRATAEKELDRLDRRLAEIDRQIAFASPTEARRLQSEKLGINDRRGAIIDAADARGAVFGGGQDEGFQNFLEGAREGVESLGQTITRAIEGPIQRMFREWKDGTFAMEEATASWISSSIDGIARFATTGKLEFRSLANQIIEDIVRIQLRMLAANLAASAGGALGNALGSTVFSFTGTSSTGTYTAFNGAAQGLTAGGFVSGPGTATSDSIAAWLSNGEFVINARAVRMFGRDTFEALNKGFAPSTLAAPRFADGGYVGRGRGRMGGDQTPLVQVVNATGAPVREETATAPDGRQVKRIVIGTLTDDLSQNGPISRLLQRSYGLNNRPGSR